MTNVVSSNPVHSVVYSIRHYVITLSVTYSRSGTLVSSTNKTNRHDITEILLKVALNTINLNHVILITYLLNSFSLKHVSFAINIVIANKNKAPQAQKTPI